MATPASETVRLLYHARALVVSMFAMAGIAVALLLARSEVVLANVGALAAPLLAATFGVLGFLAWLGWIDYASALALRIDDAGVTLGARKIPWSSVRSLVRATGAFRLTLVTDAGKVRFQLLVLPRPIASLKQLVGAATKAGVKVEPYLSRLAEHVEEESDEPEAPDPADPPG